MMYIKFIPGITRSEDIITEYAARIKQRRLEKNLSRNKLAELSGVSAATLRKFEDEGKISLESFIAIAVALGYSEELLKLMETPRYTTIEELNDINTNKSRKRGRI
ncbi:MULTISPECIES: helix-turn-helix domain-containing protein [Parabacteroides]|jgi:transcriptional regulator with XRE-family HTH domain|uniref:helix-turn-helix domain-containing protein n=1 Tax=Parabacteroides TaxID=375288 RepID=UPI001F481BEA|nr:MULTISPECIES: helix-turn-helix transcriptional regulator [Parabacteroides]WFE86143.1 helix-turn-helix transcriptional regulator [Parabacteroides chongii]